MKKIFLLLGMIGIILNANSQQNKIESTGSVGIGTTVPSSTLDVHTTDHNSATGIVISQGNSSSNRNSGRLFFENLGEQNNSFSIMKVSDRLSFRGNAQAGASSGTEYFNIKNNGIVGIGTSNPEHGKLHINGTGASQGINLWMNSGETTSRIWIDNQNKTFHLSKSSDPVKGITISNDGLVGIGVINPEHGRLHIDGNGASQGINLWTNSGEATSRIWIDNQNKTFHLSKGNNPINGITINNNGLVGIGEINPDSKLSVNGKIHTKEVKVDLIGWSDFVFYDDYLLPTLQEVENHIKEKGHLKDIPSAKEVKENGILLGEMDSKLLQKIEELTLYTIEQEKQLDRQSEEIAELKILVKKLLKTKK